MGKKRNNLNIAVRLSMDVSSSLFSRPKSDDRLSTVQPFFLEVPYPVVLSSMHLKYVFKALSELPMVVHGFTDNFPLGDKKGNPVLSNFWGFHLEHFLELTFRDPRFIHQIRPESATDIEAHDFLQFIQDEMQLFIVAWDRLGHCSSHNPSDLYAIFNEAIEKATLISTAVTSSAMTHTRFRWRGTWRNTMCNLVFQTQIPWSITVLWTGVNLFFLMSLINLTSSRKLLNSVLCTLLLLFNVIPWYLLKKRIEVAGWYAKELTVNHARTSLYSSQSFSPVETIVQFSVDNERTRTPRIISVKQETIGIITMIGFNEKLKIVFWNSAAQQCTGFMKEQVLGELLSFLVDKSSMNSILREIQTTESFESLLIQMNTTSREKVKLSAQLSRGTFESESIWLLVGIPAVDERKCEYYMKYLSDASDSIVVKKLSECIGKPWTTEKVEETTKLMKNFSWCALKYSASRKWCETDIPNIVRFLQTQITVQFHLLIRQSMAIPAFQCDIEALVESLRLWLSTIKCPESQTVQLLFSFTSENNELFMLQMELSLPPSASFRDTMDPLDGGNFQFFPYECLKNNKVTWIIPVCCEVPFEFQQLPLPERKGPLTTMGPSLRHSTMFFIIFATDTHYSFIVKRFKCKYHRFVRVRSLSELRSELKRNAESVSAFIISENVPHFPNLVNEVKCFSHSIVIASAKLRKNDIIHAPEHLLLTQNADFLLYLPVDETRWNVFLELVYSRQKEQMFRGLYSCNDLEYIQNLAQGPNSEVALVRDKQTGCTMARKEYGGNASFDTVKEIKIMARIGTHPYIVRCLGIHRESNHHFTILYAYCSGGRIREHLNFAPFPFSKLIPFASQLLQAISHIHSKGIAHMDIKPDNLLLTGQGVLQLTDFGSATDEVVNDPIVGRTIAYIPPEQLFEIPCSGEGSLCDSSLHRLMAGDLWSAGLTLLEIVGAYPSTIKGKLMKDMLNTYKTLYPKVKVLPFTLPKEVAKYNQPLQKAAENFFQLLLQIDPSKRPSADNLLEHPFLKDFQNL